MVLLYFPMFRRKTVFVLGAGASAPYGFPTATQLRRLLIGDRETNDETNEIRKQILRRVENNSSLEFVRDIIVGIREKLPFGGDYIAPFRSSGLPSIDTFLAHRQCETFNQSAKSHIASILLACENSDRLTIDWYPQLFAALTRDGEEVNNFTVVTFNYDRSLEEYLSTAYKATFGKSDGTEWLKQIPIFHVYGSLGPLETIEFGAMVKAERSVKHIKLVREQSECEEVEQIYEYLKEAEILGFLGFGFDALNMHAIGLHRGRERRFAVKQLYATSHRLAAGPKENAVELLSHFEIIWHEYTVASLLHNRNLF